MKTFTNLLLVFFEISPLLSFVAKPTAQLPFLGYSTKTTDFLLPLLGAKVLAICPIAEYIVLKIGIFFNKSLKIWRIFFPIKESDKPPIKVINIIDRIISNPGIANGK